MNHTNTILIRHARALIATLAIAATSVLATADESECNATFGPVRFCGMILPGDTLPPLARVQQIASGYAHGIALLEDGTLAFWGNDTFSQISPPEGVGVGSQRVSQVAAGMLHSVALLVDGSVVCWGANDQGQCDVPDDLAKPQPVNPVLQVDAGNNYTAALRADGSVVQWGYFDSACELPSEDEENPIVQISCGATITGAFRADGSAFICGYDITMPEEPIIDLNLFGTGGSNWMMVLTVKGEVLYWSNNWVPLVKFDPQNPVVEIDGLGNYSTMLLADGSVLSWSPNSQSSPDCASSPDMDAGLAVRRSIAAGGNHLMFKVEEYDCDNSGVGDLEEITEGLAEDCDGDFVIDSCAVAAGLAPDCNGNLVPDACDIANGAFDDNENGIPDSCDLARGDFNLDGCIDGADLGLFFGFWGDTNAPYGDFNSDGIIDGADLGSLLHVFGLCP